MSNFYYYYCWLWCCYYSYLLLPLLVRICGGCSQNDQSGRGDGKGNLSFALESLLCPGSRSQHRQASQKTPAEPLGGRRPLRQADSLSACAPSAGCGAQAQPLDLYIKAAWRAGPGECLSGAGWQESAVLPEVSERLTMASPTAAATLPAPGRADGDPVPWRSGSTSMQTVSKAPTCVPARPQGTCSGGKGSVMMWAGELPPKHVLTAEPAEVGVLSLEDTSLPSNNCQELFSLDRAHRLLQPLILGELGLSQTGRLCWQGSPRLPVPFSLPPPSPSS